MLDQLSLLVDKSLVVADEPEDEPATGVETVRQYALEKPGVRRGGNGARARHRYHYTALAVSARRPGRPAIMSSASSRLTSRSTTCAPHSGGAGKTPT